MFHLNLSVSSSLPYFRFESLQRHHCNYESWSLELVQVLQFPVVTAKTFNNILINKFQIFRVTIWKYLEIQGNNK